MAKEAAHHANNFITRIAQSAAETLGVLAQEHVLLACDVSRAAWGG
jgi:hypothetical protein